MSLFQKNPNERRYAGGEKHYLDVIKNRGTPEDIIYLNPEEDFNNGSVLVVNEAEEALFCKDGMIVETFMGGRYTLSTENYPFVSRLFNSASGGISSFNCKVYFVRMTNSPSLRWGTPTPIQVYDKTVGSGGALCDVQAAGSYIIRVTDSKLLWRKLFGGNNARSMGTGYIKDQIRDALLEDITSIIATTLEESDKPVIQMASRVKLVSDQVRPLLSDRFMEYGLSLEQFSIARLRAAPDSEYMRRLNTLRDKEVDMGADITYRAKLQRQAMEELGEGWAAQQQVDIMKSVAANPAGGVAAGAAGIGLGLGAMAPFGQAVGATMGAGAAAGAAAPAAAAPQGGATCPSCGAAVGPNAKFCPNCGSKIERAEVPAQGPKFCSNCGGKLSPGAKFCPNCGNKIG